MAMENEQPSTENNYTKEDYNKMPVYYCRTCGSLNIKVIPGTTEDYCEHCGSTDIGKTSIEAWLKLDIRKNQPFNK